MVLPRRRVIGVLGLTGLSLVALIALGWRSLNRFEGAIARALRQACVYTARETAEQIQRDFKSPVFALLELVDHPAIRNFQLEKVAATLRDGAHHFKVIDTYFVWSPASQSDRPESSGVADHPVLFYSLTSSRPDSERRPASAYASANGFYADPRLSSILQHEVQKFATGTHTFTRSDLNLDGRTYQVVYHLLRHQTDRSLLLGFEGFLTDRDHLRKGYFAEVASRWKRQQAQDLGFPELDVSVVDDGGNEVYRSGRSLLEQYEAEAQFPFVFFDADLFDTQSESQSEVHHWKVRAGYAAGGIDMIVRQESTQQRWAWVLVGVIAVAGIALTARGTAHEMRLSEMKSEFVASVSHDLKTPLAKIQLYAETLESGRTRTAEKANAYHRVISAQARELSRLIGELLDFSKIEAGVRRYALEEIDLRTVLRASIEMFDHQLAHEAYRVEVVMPDTDVPVLANGEGMQQVFENLISNAIKYSPEERYLRIELSTLGGRTRVALTDRGIGIPRREHRKIFKKFYRGSGAIATGATGSGIGLAIVDHVLRAHGGTISLASAPGQGSTFALELPLMVQSTEVQGAENSFN